MPPVLELRAVRKRYGALTAVDGLSLAVEPGTVFGLLGPNGAGKTTTLRMIMDILAPDEGEVLLFGRARRREDLDRVGYLPEERGLYRKMTVLEHLVFLGGLHGMRRREARAAAAEWLERLGLGDRQRRRVEELTTGMQQKVQLAGTLHHRPRLLILDEPFSGLDPLNQALFKRLLAEHRAGGGSIVLSTHVMEQAEKLCGRICLLSGGRAVLTGELDELKSRLRTNSYRLVADGDLERLAGVPGVTVVEPRDGVVRLELAAGVTGPAVLRELVGFLEVREFRAEEPDLEEIFVRAVRDAG